MAGVISESRVPRAVRTVCDACTLADWLQRTAAVGTRGWAHLLADQRGAGEAPRGRPGGDPGPRVRRTPCRHVRGTRAPVPHPRPPICSSVAHSSIYEL